MTLEQEWRKQSGMAAVPEPGRDRPLTGFDYVARFAAVVILLGMFGFSVWVATLVLGPYSFYLFTAILGLAAIHLYSRNRELAQRVHALDAAVEQLKAAQSGATESPTSDAVPETPSMPDEPPGAGPAT